MLLQFINETEIKETINLYLEEERIKLEMNDDPLKLIDSWWEMDEKDVRERISGIISRLKNGKYKTNNFPNIILLFLNLRDIGFEENILDEIISIMNSLIEKVDEDVVIDERNFIIEDRKLFNEYKNIIEPMKCELEKKKRSIKINEVNSCLDDVKMWGENLYKYVYKYYNKSISKMSFINELNMNKLKDNIITCDSYNMFKFRAAIYSVYDFSNIKEYYLDDIDNIKILIDIIEEIDKEKFDKIKRFNLDLLSIRLKQIHESLTR